MMVYLQFSTDINTYIGQAQECTAGNFSFNGCGSYPPDCFCKPFLMERAKVKNVTEVPVLLNMRGFEIAADSAFRAVDEALSSRLTSPECRSSFLSLLCANFYLPCEPTDPNAIATQPTAGECQDVRDNKCFAQWKLLELFRDTAQVLPNCSSFDGSDENTELRPEVVCNEQFGLYCDSLCLPLCEEFSQNSDGLTLLQDILFIFAGLSSLIGGTIVIIISIYRRSSM